MLSFLLPRQLLLFEVRAQEVEVLGDEVHFFDHRLVRRKHRGPPQMYYFSTKAPLLVRS